MAKSGWKSIQRRRDNLAAYLLIGPCVILLTIFVVIPLVNAVRWSFYNWSFYVPPTFIGWKNYRIVLGDRAFGQSIGVGLLWVLEVVPLQFVVSLVCALLLSEMRSRFSSLMKTIVYTPQVTSVVVASWVFMFIYDYQSGILNYVVRLMGGERVAWLAKVNLALPAEAVVGIWLGFGLETLILLAGINDIPATYYEAARIDGANYLQRVFQITLPSLRNVFLFVLVTSVTAAIQEFQIQQLMTQGGPLGVTTTPNLLIFEHFRDDPGLGYTMTAALLLFVVITAISLFLFRIIRSEKLGE